MNTKLILFDLDGVLIDAKDIHYRALNDALGEDFAISPEDHRNIYDGRKTYEKLEILTKRKGLPSERHEQIFQDKQSATVKELQSTSLNLPAIKLLDNLQDLGYTIGVCSNSIRRTVLTALAKSGLI